MTLASSVLYARYNIYDITILDVQLCDPGIIVLNLLVILGRFTKQMNEPPISLLHLNKTDESK